MSDLLKNVLEAHGGSDRWAETTKLRAAISVHGWFWGVKGWPSAERGLERLTLEIDTLEQASSLFPFTDPNLRSRFTVGPERVSIETLDGRHVEERNNPRAAFEGQTLESPWDRQHLAYFMNYALWNYFVTPFVLAYPGMQTREIQPWEEDGETWRRLHVTFPASIATHSTEQVFYFDRHFMQRRFDYAPYAVAEAPAAHYTDEPQTFDGFVFPTLRRVYLRDPATNRHNRDMHIITCEVLSVSIS